MNYDDCSYEYKTHYGSNGNKIEIAFLTSFPIAFMQQSGTPWEIHSSKLK